MRNTEKGEGGMDFALGLGYPDPDIGCGLSLAWVHLRRFTVGTGVSTGNAGSTALNMGKRR